MVKLFLSVVFYLQNLTRVVAVCKRAILRIRRSLNLDASCRRMVGYGQAVMDEVALIGLCFGKGGGSIPLLPPVGSQESRCSLFFRSPRKRKKNNNEEKKIRKKEVSFCLPDARGVHHPSALIDR